MRGADVDVESAIIIRDSDDVAMAASKEKWSLNKKAMVGATLLVAIVLVILLPLVLVRGDSDVNGLGFEEPDIFSENPDGNEAKPEDSTADTTANEAVPSPAPTLSPTYAPRTLAPASTQTACSTLNVTSANSTQWVGIADKILGEASEDLSGLNIAMSADGSIVAIGAPLNSGVTTKSGHVRVYRYDSGGYVQLGQDIDGENEWDWFGTSVALDADGHRLAVGGRWADSQHSNDTGHVRIFDFSEDSDTWEKVGEDLEGQSEGDQFGRAVGLSADGQRLVIGASHADASVNKTDVGHVYIYELSENGLAVPIGELEGDDEEDLSGATLSFSEDGTHLAVAATRHDAPNGIPDVGQVKIFRFEPDLKKWSKIGSSIEGTTAGAQAGLSVAISSDGSRVAVSFSQSIMGVPIPGVTRVYELMDKKWVKLGENDLTGGSSIAMSRSPFRIAVGDYMGFLNGRNAGYAHVYELDETFSTWELVGQVINGNRDEMSGSAVALSADGMRLAISSPRSSSIEGQDAGAVQVYDLC